MRYINCWTLQTIHLTDTVCSDAKTHQESVVVVSLFHLYQWPRLINGLVVISHLPQATFHQ